MRSQWLKILITTYGLLVANRIYGQDHFLVVNRKRIDFHSLPFELSVVDYLAGNKQEVIPIDIDNDNNDEILYWLNVNKPDVPNHIKLSTIDPKSFIFDHAVSGVISSPTFFDVVGDEDLEILYSEIRNDTAFLHIINKNGEDYDATDQSHPAGIGRG